MKINKSIANFTKTLKARSLIPKHIQFSSWNNWTIVNVFDDVVESFISEYSSTGIDKNPEVAYMKALIEFNERRIFRSSNESAATIMERSDGFAGYPTFLPNYKENARQNSYGEAVERLLWSSWWDNSNTLYVVEDYQANDRIELIKEFELESIKIISVSCNDSNVCLKIILAKLPNAGYVTGGAAGSYSEVGKTIDRAFGEVLRHLFVTRKMKDSQLNNLSFYEERLWGFASGKWNGLVQERLNISGKDLIILPALIIDQEISQPNNDLIYIHRCLFENQPIFMGGKVERLCI